MKRTVPSKPRPALRKRAVPVKTVALAKPAAVPYGAVVPKIGSRSEVLPAGGLSASGWYALGAVGLAAAGLYGLHRAGYLGSTKVDLIIVESQTIPVKSTHTVIYFVTSSGDKPRPIFAVRESHFSGNVLTDAAKGAIKKYISDRLKDELSKKGQKKYTLALVGKNGIFLNQDREAFVPNEGQQSNFSDFVFMESKKITGLKENIVHANEFLKPETPVSEEKNTTTTV